MWTRRCLLVVCLVTAAASLLIACGDDDERQTPDCNTTDCFTNPDGGTTLNVDGGSD